MYVFYRHIITVSYGPYKAYKDVNTTSWFSSTVSLSFGYYVCLISSQGASIVSSIVTDIYIYNQLCKLLQLGLIYVYCYSGDF